MRSRSVLLMALLPGIVACSISPRASEQRHLQIEHRAQAPLHVRTANGGVRITVDPAIQGVQVDAKVTTSGATEGEARERLQATEILMERGSDGGLTVEPRFSGGKRRGDGCRLSIRIPSLSELRVDTSNGPITVSDTSGSASLGTRNGPVRVEGHAGDLTVRTSNGGITVLSVDGEIDVGTSNGGIELRDVSGVVRAETSNGGIGLHSTESRDQAFHLGTSNGRIDITLPGAPRGVVHCRTSHGSIRSEGTPLAEVSGSKRDQRISLGGGGPDSVVKTSNGSITLRFGH